MRGAVMDDSYRIGPRAATAVVGQTAHRVVPEIFFTTRRVACVAMLTTAVRGARHVTRIAISRTIRYRSCGPMPPSTVVTARDRILTGMVTTVRSRITDQTGEPIRFPMGGSTDLSAARVAPRHVTHRSACTIWLPVRANARYRAGVVTCCAAPQRIPLNITAAVSPPVRRDTRHTMQFGMGNAACNATRARARQPVGRTACCVRERLAEVAPPNASHQAFCQKRVPLRNLQHTRMGSGVCSDASECSAGAAYHSAWRLGLYVAARLFLQVDGSTPCGATRGRPIRNTGEHEAPAQGLRADGVGEWSSRGSVLRVRLGRQP